MQQSSDTISHDDHPRQNPIDRILSQLPHARPTGHGYRAPCPAHDGENPTALSITEAEDGAVLLHCFSRDCTQEAILAAIGLTWADCFRAGDRRRTRPSPKAKPEAATNGKPADAQKVLLQLAVHQAVGLILGPLAPPVELELLGEYAGLIEYWQDLYAERGSHEAVEEAYLGMREDLARQAPKFSQAIARRLRDRRGQAAETSPADHPPSSDQKPETRPVVTTMSDVKAEAIEWLWWPYVAVGKLCMLDGDPGIGKTLLMTQLAASLSRGHPLPDQQGQPTLDPGGPQTTVLLSDEDGLADTLKPRLEAAGADCSKIHVLTGWLDPEDHFHAVTLHHRLTLEETFKQYQPRLVVIDPIQAYLGGIDMHRANETRPLLAGLTRLAERYRCAIVCIRHPSKPGQGEGKVIYRGLGSIDFIGAARTALFVEQHPADPDRALMAQSKSNVGRLGRTQVYSKAEGVFRWCGVSRLTAELMAGSGRGPDPHAFLGVVCWLEDHLKPGIPRRATKLMEALGEEGYSGVTAKRAKKALGIISQKTPPGVALEIAQAFPPSSTTI